MGEEDGENGAVRYLYIRVRSCLAVLTRDDTRFGADNRVAKHAGNSSCKVRVGALMRRCAGVSLLGDESSRVRPPT